ncbi:MAG: flavodoxin domain-containing protein [Treponema sp.]|nr:flavodoxin domain-containing protein [Treponema sp.]
MSDTLVLYTSKRGSTRQYAEWIASALSADLHEPRQFLSRDWEKYSTVVYCGGLYANSVNGIRFIAKNHVKLRGKKIVVVACGLSYPHIAESVTRVVNGISRKLPQAMHANARLFMVRGSVTYSRLGFFEKFIIKMLEKMLRKKDPDKLIPEEQEMLSVLGNDFSFVDRASIQPIVDYCKGIETP